jgi:hypothetical protein
MNKGEKILLTAVILIVDFLLFMLPVTAFFAIYVLWARPAWFLSWVKDFYDSE